MKKIILIPTALVLAALAAGGAWLVLRPGDGVSMAKLTVQGMDCGSCVEKVRSALMSHPAVKSANVNLSQGKATVEFRGGKAAAEDVCERICSAGYRSGLAEYLSPRKYRAWKAEREARARTDVASVNGYPISRADLKREYLILGERLSKSSVGKTAEELTAEAYDNLFSRAVILGEAKRQGITVTDAQVDERLKTIGAAKNLSPEEMKAAVSGFYPGWGDYREEVRRQMVMDKYVEDVIAGKAADPALREERVAMWRAKAFAKPEVEIYDKNLEALLAGRSSSGCNDGGC